MKALVVGSDEPAAALTAALVERGVEATLHAPPEGRSGSAAGALAGELVALEATLEADAPDLAVAVGRGDGPIALAITAAKLGVALAWWQPPQDGASGELAAGQARILATLADRELAGVAEVAEAAERIASGADRDAT